MTRQEQPCIIVAGPCGGVIPKTGERPAPQLPVLARILLAMTGERSRETWARQAIGGRLDKYMEAEGVRLRKRADREAGG